MARIPMLVAILVLQTTSISLFLLTLGLQPLPWLVLLLVLVAGAITDWQLERLEEDRQRPWLVSVAVIVALVAVSLHVGGLGVALYALLPGSGSPLFASAYGTLLVALFAFWCGTRSRSHSPGSIAQTFSLGVFVAIVGLLLAPLINSLNEAAHVRGITLQLLVLVGSGLLAQALVRAEDENEGEQRRWSWRWLATFGVAIGAVMLIGLTVSSIFGGTAAAILELLWGGVMILLFLIMLPILFILGWLVDLLIGIFGLPTIRYPSIQTPQPPAFSENAQSLFPNASAWAFNTIAAGVALLPLVILVVLILFARRRRRAAGKDEERESLLSWETVSADLRGLLAGLRRPRARTLTGLRAAWAALTGDDPISRVRRAYLRLLIDLESRERPRPTASTPSEYAPTVRENFPNASSAVTTLTRAYERARYAARISDTDANAAEQAWSEIERESAKREP